ncbi:MAG: septum formation family protein [Acidimicrobiales bacterium]
MIWWRWAVFGVVLLVVTGCGDSVVDRDQSTRDGEGTIVGAGLVGVQVLQVGDCYDEPETGEMVEMVPAVPCGELHDNEVYALFDVAEDEYPGADEVELLAVSGCVEAFTPYVGLTMAESAYDVFPLTPNENGWRFLDDRGVICVLTGLDGPLRESAQDSRASVRDTDKFARSGSISTFALAEGDCFDSPPAGLDEAEVALIDCDDAHSFEVFATVELAESDFPGQAEVDRAAGQECRERFETFHGLAYADSVFDISWYAPTQQSWDVLVDRRVSCLTSRIDGAVSTGSARGVGE